jgi:transcription antitermination protein NusB
VTPGQVRNVEYRSDRSSPSTEGFSFVFPALWPNRRQARVLAMVVLYSLELDPGDVQEKTAGVLKMLGGARPAVLERARYLVQGVLQHQSELDAIIQRLAHHWELDRLSPITRNVLRIALFEHLHDGLDLALVIHEAVELAKTFAEDDAFRFIHGLLDQLRSQGA